MSSSNAWLNSTPNNSESDNYVESSDQNGVNLTTTTATSSPDPPLPSEASEAVVSTVVEEDKVATSAATSTITKEEENEFGEESIVAATAEAEAADAISNNDHKEETTEEAAATNKENNQNAAAEEEEEEEEDFSSLPEPEYDYLDFSSLGEEDLNNQQYQQQGGWNEQQQQHQLQLEEDLVRDDHIMAMPPSFTECHTSSNILYHDDDDDGNNVYQNDIANDSDSARSYDEKEQIRRIGANENEEEEEKKTQMLENDRLNNNAAAIDSGETSMSSLPISESTIPIHQKKDVISATTLTTITSAVAGPNVSNNNDYHYHNHEEKQEEEEKRNETNINPSSYSAKNDVINNDNDISTPNDNVNDNDDDNDFSKYILGTLVVKVVAARNLKPIVRSGLGQLLFGSHHHHTKRNSRHRSSGGGGGSNPYAKILFDNQSQRTTMLYDTIHPIWPREEQSYFDVTLPISDLVQEEDDDDHEVREVKRDKLGYIIEDETTNDSSRKKGKTEKQKRGKVFNGDEGFMSSLASSSLPLVADPVLTVVIFHCNGIGDGSGAGDTSKKYSIAEKEGFNKEHKDTNPDENDDTILGFASINIRHLLTGKVTIIDEWFPISDSGCDDSDDSGSDDIYAYSAGEVRLLCEYEPSDPPPRTGDLCRITGFCCPADLYPVPAHLLFHVDEVDGDDIILSYKTEEEGWNCTFVAHRFSIVCAKRHQAAIERYREGLIDVAEKLVHSPLVKVVTETVVDRLPEDGVLFVGAGAVLGGLGLMGRWVQGGIGTALDDVVNATNWDGRHTPRLLEDGEEQEEDNDVGDVHLELNNAGLSGDEEEGEDLDHQEELYEEELDGLQEMHGGSGVGELSSTTSLSSLSVAAALPCCPITGQNMKDPVVAADGHTYERRAIQRWLRSSDTSPLTGQKLSHKELVPNYLLLSSTAQGGR